MEATRESPGLRERKKAATRQALHEAALRLTLRDGFGRVTVEAIADAAEVSRRTFSNYFSSKEEALLYGDQARMRLFADTLRARPAAEPPWTALQRTLAALRDVFGARDPALAAQLRLLRTHSALIAQQLATYATLERELAAEFTARGTLPPLRARLLAATFLTAVRVAGHQWAEDGGATPLPDLLEEVLGHLRPAFD